MEEAEPDCTTKATNLTTTFGPFFCRMSHTVHPAGLPGEARGKSSNQSWAAKEACRYYYANKVNPDLIITVMDGEWDHFVQDALTC